MQEEEIKKDVISHMVDLKERLRDVTERAKLNADKARKDYKMHFDKRSSVRMLEIDDPVLIFTPSSEKKLFAEWVGPHKIMRKLENNNYERQLPKRKCVQHTNMLKRFYEQGAIVVSVLLAEGDEEEETTDFPNVLELGLEGKENELKIRVHLLENQKDEMQEEEIRKHVISHMVDRKERLRDVTELAKLNEDKAQKDYKMHFDKHSSVRTLEICDSVLILTPSSEKKLFAEWLGPHKIFGKLENNNYEFQLP